MVKRGKRRRMFPGGNTALGFHSFFDYIIQDDYNKRYIIKGGPGSGKSTFMYGIGEYMQNKGYDITEFHCSTDPDSLDAIAIPKLGVAILDGMPPHAAEPKNIGITDQIIWLGQYCSGEKLMDSKDEILGLNLRADKLFQMAFSYLREAKEAYDRLRSFGKDAMILSRYKEFITRVMGELFGEVRLGMEEGGPRTHFFASAISGQGYYSYTKELIEPNYSIYGFAGMPGSGARKAIMDIALEAKRLGLGTEAFHCPIDVEELDMLIIPQLQSIIIYMDQFSEGDDPLFDYSQLEFYANFDDNLNEDFLDEYKEDIEKTLYIFNNTMGEAIDCIGRARLTHDRIEKYYVDAMDFESVDRKREEILAEIISLEKKDI